MAIFLAINAGFFYKTLLEGLERILVPGEG